MASWRQIARAVPVGIAVVWDGGAQILRWVGPDLVVCAVADRLAAVLAQVAFEVAALQAAVSMVSGSTWPVPIGGSRPSSW